MLTSLNVYLFITLYCNVLSSIGILTILSIIYIIGHIGYRFSTWTDEDNIDTEVCTVKHLKKICVILSVCSFLLCVLPTKEEAVTIYLLPKIVNNEQVRNIPVNILTIVNKYINKAIDKNISETVDIIVDKTTNVAKD